ncbi:hypothetical protein OH76DRAFT_1399235 [Lentinus brumalis]|uniref:Uncharacterized protein n=1 Tax=Lentinus brumalis TaxID=2498619 RepID=A0A371DLD2_9APHY|nr:hypothetical protein OH76DRAFT_1399235 [Polyporus brumalis]
MSSASTTITTPRSRHVLPREAKSLREVLYLGGHMPTLAEKRAIYDIMLLVVPGISWYTPKHHFNWCLTQEHEA